MTCLKKCYTSRSIAKRIMKKLHLKNVYFCEECQHWHLTSIKKENFRDFKINTMEAKKSNQTKELEKFKKKYPTVTSADLQTFIIGYNVATKHQLNKIKAIKKRLINHGARSGSNIITFINKQLKK